MACAGFLAGCGISSDRDVETGLVERQVGGWKPTSASPSASPAKENEAAPQQLSQVAEKYMSANKPGNGAYKVGPMDVLEISVFKVPELSKSVQVADSGSVNLPLVGEIPAAGKTAQDLERDLTARLSGKYLHNPQVTVYVREFNSQRATIEGAIKSPGIYPLKGKTTLLQIVAMAGSLDKETASTDVVVFREVDGKKFATRYDIDEIRNGNIQDPSIQQGDVIIVDSSTSKVIFSNVMRVLPLASVVPIL